MPGAHGRAHGVERLEREVHGGDVGAVDALVDLAGGAPGLHRERHMVFAVVVVVEGRALGGGVEDTQADHGRSVKEPAPRAARTVVGPGVRPRPRGAASRSGQTRAHGWMGPGGRPRRPADRGVRGAPGPRPPAEAGGGRRGSGRDLHRRGRHRGRAGVAGRLPGALDPGRCHPHQARCPDRAPHAGVRGRARRRAQDHRHGRAPRDDRRARPPARPDGRRGAGAGSPVSWCSKR